jgi:hypothetical protein
VIFYRLWKALVAYSHLFEVGSGDGISDLSLFQSNEGRSGFARILELLLFPWSQVMVFFFSQISGPSDQEPSRIHQPRPAPSKVDKSRKSKGYIHDSSIEEFLLWVLKKVDLTDDDSKPNIATITAMLKGNWFTTVADLRKLELADAERLGISKKFWEAMQEELPREGQEGVFFLFFFLFIIRNRKNQKKISHPLSLSLPSNRTQQNRYGRLHNFTIACEYRREGAILEDVWLLGGGAEIVVLFVFV